MLNRLKQLARRLRSQLGETAICLALGLKDSLRWSLLWPGLRLVTMLGLSWLLVFVVWRHDVLAVSLFLGGAGVFEYVLPWLQLVPGLGFYASALALITAVVLAPFVAVLLIVVSFLGLLLLSFHWMSIRSLLPKVKTCVERQYPNQQDNDFASPLALSRHQHLRLIVTAALGTAVCLLLPVVGGLLLLLWIGYLSARGIALRVLKGAASGDHSLRLIRHARLSLTLVGSCLTLLLLVPFFGLLAPTAMTASAAHLMKRSLGRVPYEPNQ